MDALLWIRQGICRSIFPFAVVCSLATVSPVSFAVEPGNSGVDWLLSQQSADGRIAITDDLVSPDHGTTEALRALHGEVGLSGPWAEARLFLDAQVREAIPWLSRRLLATTLAGDGTEAMVVALLGHQNPDGGFAAARGEQSSVLDTVDALEALGKAGLRDPAVVQPAVGYLLSQQRGDGAFAATPASPPSVYLTARAIAALQRYQFEYGFFGSVQAAISFLESERLGDGWESHWESAQALLALLPTTAEPGRHADVLDVLRAAQAPSGSWGGSVYTTALVLRSLRHVAAGASAVGGQAGVTGRVMDPSLAVPLAGTSVRVDGVAGSQTVTAGSDGRFLLELPESGVFTLRFDAAGFESLTRVVEVRPAQTVDLGTVALRLPAGMALLVGQVTDAATGSGIPATITASGAAQALVHTDATGSYTLPLAEGEIHLSVKATGYLALGAEAVLEAGQRIGFSPALFQEEVSEANATVELSGRVLDAETGAPVSGAAVRVIGSAVLAVSDAGGHFVLAGLLHGAVAVEVVHASYRTVRLGLLVTSGSRIDLGDLLLQPVAGSATWLVGQVVDADSVAPLPGARIQVGDSVTESDADGRFEIEGIAELDFEVRVSATGYRTVTRGVLLGQPGPVRLDFALERTGHEGVRITGLLAHEESIGAFHEARFSVVVENRGDVERQVILSASVEALGGDFREDFVVPATAVSRLSAFPLAPAEPVLREFSWFTRHVEPGLYRILAQVWNADATMLLDARAVVVNVTETLQIAALGLVALPRELVRGETREVELSAIVRNASNLPGTLEFSLHLLDPSGASVHEQDVRLEIPPSAATLDFPIARPEQTFEHAGTYTLEFAGISGPPVQDIETGRIDVAPNVRIDGAHQLEPPQVPPLQDARVRIRLTMEGREDEQ